MDSLVKHFCCLCPFKKTLVDIAKLTTGIHIPNIVYFN